MGIQPVIGSSQHGLTSNISFGDEWYLAHAYSFLNYSFKNASCVKSTLVDSRGSGQPKLQN